MLITNLFFQIVHKVHTEADDVLKSIGNWVRPITSTLVLITAELKAEDGETIRVRQCTEAEEKLSNIYRMLGINPHPLGKIKSVVHPKPPSKNANTENLSVT